MEHSIDNIHKFKLYTQTSPDVTSALGYGFVHEGTHRFIQPYPQHDFYLPVFITRTGNLLEYVEITHDDSIFVMERQEVNPFFIEFSFFDTIKRNRVNDGIDLTNAMLNFIRSVRPDVASLIDTDLKLKNWFDNIGRYELPWNKGTSNQIDIDTIDKVSFINQNIISKANSLNITINK